MTVSLKQMIATDLGGVLAALRALNRAATVDEVQTAGSRVGRNSYPDVVHALHEEGLLTQDAAAVTVPDAWSAAEHPLRRLTREQWRSLFDYAGYTHDLAPATRPTESLTLYRGATRARRTDWSWTPALGVAERFTELRANEGDTHVWTAVVDPPHLLAFIDGASRDEVEYVVDTDGVTITLYAE